MNYLVFAMEGEEWELNHKITVDYINKHLVVAARVVDLDIKTDVYSDYKEWFKLRNNSGYGTKAIRTIGGDPTVSGEFAGDIYFLKNGWRLVYNPRKVKIVGALFSDDYDTAYLDRSTLEEIFPAKVASIVTQIQANLDDLNIPTAIQIAAQVRAELAAELAQVTDSNTRVTDIHQFDGADSTNPATISGDGITSSVVTTAGKTKTITPTSITRT